MNFLKKHLPVFLGIGAYFLICRLLQTTCLIKKVIGFDCPTCGMTRAVISLLHADVDGYLYYNPMALPMFISVWLFIHRRLFGDKKWITYLMIIVLSLTMLRYVITIFA